MLVIIGIVVWIINIFLVSNGVFEKLYSIKISIGEIINFFKSIVSILILNLNCFKLIEWIVIFINNIVRGVVKLLKYLYVFKINFGRWILSIISIIFSIKFISGGDIIFFSVFKEKILVFLDFLFLLILYVLRV